MIKSLSKSEKNSILLLLVVLSGYLYFVFYLTPIISAVNRDKAAIKKYQGIGLSRTGDKNLAGKENNLSDILPNMEKNSAIAYNIKIMSDKFGVKLSKLSFGEVEPLSGSSGKVMFAPVSVCFYGFQENITRLLGEIESDKRLCEIRNMTLNINGNDMEKTGITADIRYYFMGD